MTSVTMNSCFGFSMNAKDPCEPLAQTITLLGRQLLKLSAKIVNTGAYPKELRQIYDGCPRVIYGDTDSNFIYCPGATEEQAAKFTEKLAEYITNIAINRPPVEMEFEKTLVKMISINRKNYVYSYRNRAGQLAVDFYGGEKVKRDYSNFFQTKLSEL